MGTVDILKLLMLRSVSVTPDGSWSFNRLFLDPSGKQPRGGERGSPHGAVGSSCLRRPDQLTGRDRTFLPASRAVRRGYVVRLLRVFPLRVLVACTWGMVTPGLGKSPDCAKQVESLSPTNLRARVIFLSLVCKAFSLCDFIFGWLPWREAIGVRSKNEGLGPGLR